MTLARGFVILMVLPLTDLVFSFKLTILHTNDIHSRYGDINTSGQRCNYSAAEKCFGGVVRLKTMVDFFREIEKNLLVLDAGDIQTGSLWYLTYRGNASSHFMKQVGYDVMVNFYSSIT